MNDLKVFENDQLGNIRVIDQDGEPYFVLKDVCEVFGETNYRRVSANLDEDEKGVSQINTPGGLQSMTTINESGLYSTLFTMRPTKARGVSEEYIADREQKLSQFRRWVTHEVLPSIRKHGAYMTNEALYKAITEPDFLIKLATELRDEKDLRMKMQSKIESDRPKVLFANAVDASHTSILVGELAKLIKQNGVEIGQNRLFQWLRDNGYLLNTNMPSQYSMERKWFEVKERTINNPDGSVRITKTTLVTGKGQVYFVNRFLQSERM